MCSFLANNFFFCFLTHFFLRISQWFSLQSCRYRLAKNEYLNKIALRPLLTEICSKFKCGYVYYARQMCSFMANNFFFCFLTHLFLRISQWCSLQSCRYRLAINEYPNKIALRPLLTEICSKFKCGYAAWRDVIHKIAVFLTLL